MIEILESVLFNVDKNAEQRKNRKYELNEAPEQHQMTVRCDTDDEHLFEVTKALSFKIRPRVSELFQDCEVVSSLCEWGCKVSDSTYVLQPGLAWLDMLRAHAKSQNPPRHCSSS